MEPGCLSGPFPAHRARDLRKYPVACAVCSRPVQSRGDSVRGSGSGVLLRGMCTGACINALHTKLAFFQGRGVFHEGCDLRAQVGALTTVAAALLSTLSLVTWS